MEIFEHPGGVSKRGTKFGPRLQIAMPNGWPPPHDRQFYDMGPRELAPDVERILAWKPPPGWNGKSVERLALETIGQGMSSVTQDTLTDEQVAAVMAAWVKWAKAPAPAAKGA